LHRRNVTPAPTPPASRAIASGWTVTAILMAAYATVFAALGAFSLQDYPNHLARAVAMADLIFHGGARFGGMFTYHFAAVPYVLGDLFLAGAVALFGVTAATALWMALVVLSLPLALLVYLRTTQVPAYAQILIVVLSLYLSTDGFLFMGFMSFRLAIAITIICLALVRRLRQTWSAGVFTLYCTLVAAGYFLHLSTIVFLAAAIGASVAVRLLTGSARVRTESYFLIPLVLLALSQLGAAPPEQAPGDLPGTPYVWGSWGSKIARLPWDFMRYYGTRIDGRIEKALLLAFIVCLLWSVRKQLRRAAPLQPAVLEMLLATGAFLGMYILLPSTYGAASYLDLRPLALVPVMLLIGCGCLLSEQTGAAHSGARGATALAVLLVSANLVYLTWHLLRDDVWIRRYEAVVAAIPQGARVLPLYPGTDALRPFMHAAAIAVIDRGALIPYLFSGNRGTPQTYFRYRHLPYAPPESWYYVPSAGAQGVDWRAVECSYDFLLVMQPFEPRRIRVPTTPVVQNASAALLALQKPNACGS
jgi:hypothetical protein